MKVLDFGLAKLAAPAAAGDSQLSPSIAPTITSPALMTGLGALLGTAAYMGPEQAKGRDADERSDVWAFGCVLYEMFTGRRAFEGEDVSDTVAAVLRADPEWFALQATAPVAIRTLLRSCLEKDRRKRLADLSGALFVLDHTASLVEPAPVAPPEPVTGRSHRAWRRAASLAAAIAVSIVFGGTFVWWWTQSPPPPAVRTAITPPESAALTLSGFDRDIVEPTHSPCGRQTGSASRSPQNRTGVANSL